MAFRATLLLVVLTALLGCAGEPAHCWVCQREIHPQVEATLTPANGKQGQDLIIAGSVSDDDAKKQSPAGWKAPKPYLRIVPHPKQ